jgi:hypothetical protein
VPCSLLSSGHGIGHDSLDEYATASGSARADGLVAHLALDDSTGRTYVQSTGNCLLAHGHRDGLTVAPFPPPFPAGKHRINIGSDLPTVSGLQK